MSVSCQAAVHKQFVDLLRQCNGTARPARDEHEFFQLLCDVLVKSGLFQFAWFGYEDEVARKIIKPLAHSGDLQGFLQVLNAGLRTVGSGGKASNSIIHARDPNQDLKNQQTSIQIRLRHDHLGRKLRNLRNLRDLWNQRSPLSLFLRLFHKLAMWSLACIS